MNKRCLNSFLFIFLLLPLFSCSQTKQSSLSSQTKTYILTLYISPPEGGKVVLNPQGGAYTEGTIVNLEAVANPGYVFDRWEGSITGRENPTTIRMDSDKIVYAYFVKASTNVPQAYYKLHVNISPQNAGDVNINPLLNDYPENTEVQLTALPKEGYIFSNWSGDVNSVQNPISVIMDADKNITAYFVEKSTYNNGGNEVVIYKLTVNVNPQGAGEISLNPIGGEYLAGTSVEIKAISISGYVFYNWSGDLESTDNPLNVVMDSDKNITANFIQGYVLTIEINPPGVGSVVFNPEGTKISENQRVYLPGTSVQLTAVPNPGYKFHQWIGGIGASFQFNKANPITITINSNVNIAASFVEE